ncbi:competence protein CoiA family protein [Streptococcaceae bacterium ESL0729]|nr:competence protein CoiA family protein [Streptococcaceae bacterium ESL0729]
MIIGQDAGGTIINLADLKEFSSLKDKPYYCPYCYCRLIFKNGQLKAAHFAHESLRDCSLYWENESLEHLSLKKMLYRWFCRDNQAQLEFYLPPIKQVADIMVEDKLAIEIQCSPLSLKRLRERTSSYQEIGITVIWILGKKLHLTSKLTELKENFLYFSSNIGFYYWELDYEAQILTIKYLIHVDLKGRLIFRSQNFAFNQGKLLDILRFPYQARRLEVIRADAPFNQKYLKSYLRRQLMVKNSRWLKLQELYYQEGKNILITPLPPIFYFPPAFSYYLRLLGRKDSNQLIQTSKSTASIQNYYENYLSYYLKIKKSSSFLLYPPKFYDKMNPK